MSTEAKPGAAGEKPAAKPRARSIKYAVVSLPAARVEEQAASYHDGGYQPQDNAGQFLAILLGGRADADDPMAIYHLTEEGIPLDTVRKFVSAVPSFDNDNLLTKIVGLSERTLHRRLKNPEEPLTPDQSSRAVRFAQVLTKAIVVLGNVELAEQWMSNPAIGLDGHKPGELLLNPHGFELVNDLLTRMEYGVYQ